VQAKESVVKHMLGIIPAFIGAMHFFFFFFSIKIKFQYTELSELRVYRFPV